MIYNSEKCILELKKMIVEKNERAILKSIIFSSLESIDEWHLTSNADKYDVVPNVLCLIGKELKNKEYSGEDFHSLSDGLNKGLCVVGLREGKIAFNIEQIFFNSKNNTLITCYLEDNLKTTRIIMQCSNYSVDENTLLFNEDYEINISSIRLSYEYTKDILYSATVYKQSDSEILIYKKISHNLFSLDHLQYDSKLILNYKVSYTYECDELGEVVMIKNSNNLQVYPSLYQYNDDNYLFEKIFLKLNIQNKSILNDYILSIDANNNNIKDLLLSIYNELNFDELEEVLEFIYPIYELPKDIRFIEYINDELDIKFIDWSNLNKFLIILQNVVQDLVDDF